MQQVQLRKAIDERSTLASNHSWRLRLCLSGTICALRIPNQLLTPELGHYAGMINSVMCDYDYAHMT